MMPVSERRICRVLGQHRSTQRKMPRGADDEAALTEDIIALARQYGRYGYRRVTALLRDAGWHVNRKRVERIWRREGLKVPQKQPKRGRLWLNDGSCIRLRPEYPGHVWSYDFVEGRTHEPLPEWQIRRNRTAKVSRSSHNDHPIISLTSACAICKNMNEKPYYINHII